MFYQNCLQNGKKCVRSCFTNHETYKNKLIAYLSENANQCVKEKVWLGAWEGKKGTKLYLSSKLSTRVNEIVSITALQPNMFHGAFQ